MFKIVISYYCLNHNKLLVIPTPTKYEYGRLTSSSLSLSLSLSLSEGHLSTVPVRSDEGGGSFPAGHEEGPSVGAD